MADYYEQTVTDGADPKKASNWIMGELIRELKNDGRAVAHLHLRSLNPFPRGLGKILSRYKKVLIPELNLGQLALLIRARFLIDTMSFTKVQGSPFTIIEVEKKIGEVLS